MGLYDSKDLPSLSKDDLTRFLEKKERERATSTRFFKPPGACRILIVTTMGMYGQYAAEIIRENEAKDLSAQRYKIDPVVSLEESVVKLVGSISEGKTYDAVIIPQRAEISAGDLTISALEFMLSIKGYRTAQEDYPKKKAVIKKHIPISEEGRDIQLGNLRNTYLEVPFIYLCTSQTDPSIKQLVALQRKYTAEKGLQSINFFEVAPGNQAELLKFLNQVIKTKDQL